MGLIEVRTFNVNGLSAGAQPSRSNTGRTGVKSATVFVTMTITGTIDDILRHKGSVTWTITPDKTVFEAIELMSEKNIGALVVMEGGQVVGVLSERDYTRKVALRGKSSKETLIREILSSPVISVTPETTVEEGLRCMTQHRVRHLPVLEAGRLIGIVSIGDLVNQVINVQTAAIHQLHNYISGQYPG